VGSEDPIMGKKLYTSIYAHDFQDFFI